MKLPVDYSSASIKILELLQSDTIQYKDDLVSKLIGEGFENTSVKHALTFLRKNKVINRRRDPLGTLKMVYSIDDDFAFSISSMFN